MISGIIFILISWLVSGFPLWLSITLTIWGVLKILFDFIKIARREIENEKQTNDEMRSCRKRKNG
jgi:type III secretory pathway component EscV